ncbi:helix-turn-helix domain-containing protein [Saccharothrix deserti]|uniref:helix-turn-helix domain-containing protein n=1 Tax=Saccharothrix deserti TaxID=2593674 RepID=UPI00131A8254|nr:helix-turn-helix transcriptional regulator [Saccharothrix deserti]
MPSTQTRRKRRLGEYLTGLRKASSHDPASVARILRKSPATVSKIENGHVRPDFPTLSVLLALYNADDEQRHAAESLWEDAVEEANRVEHTVDMSPKYRAFLRSEADAVSARTLQQTVIPGLLQTARYATAIHVAEQRFQTGKRSLEKSVASRLARQRRLDDARDPLSLHAIIDEAVLRRVVGGPEVMAEQLRHLLDRAAAPNITVQVLPYQAGAHAVMTSAITILGFGDPSDPDSVYLEYHGGGRWIEDEAAVAAYAAEFEALAALALPTEESVALVRKAAVEMEES